MNSPLGRLIGWFNSASGRTKWIAGLVGVCILGMAGLLLLTGTPTTAGTTAASDPLSSTPTLLLDVFVKLGAVLILIVAAAFLLRRWQSGSFRATTRQLAIVESLRLSQRQALHLVRAGDKLLLIGATDQTLSLISPIELKEEASIVKDRNGLEIKDPTITNIENGFGAALEDEKDPAHSSS